MLSAVGTGSILFMPRVAAVYEYQLLWLLLLVVFFMWIMIREMARFTIVTGRTMLQGMNRLPGPQGWAVWVIFVPQLAAAAIGIAGLSAIAGSAVGETTAGSNALYGIGTVVMCTLFTASGRYVKIELFSRFMAMLLVLLAIAAAVIVFPNAGKIAQGLTFQWPEQPRYYVILPWVGTILAGSMGIVWFGYWTATRGFGGGLVGTQQDDEAVAYSSVTEGDRQSREVWLERGRSWIRLMTGTATLGVLGGLSVLFSFMVLGSELLAPTGTLPQGSDVAIDLTRMFSDVWGSTGKWLLLVTIVIALVGSVLANQDGWGRSFSDMTLILLRNSRQTERKNVLIRTLDRLQPHLKFDVYSRVVLKRIFIVLVTGIIPVIIILLFEDPVKVMSVSGIIAAAHTPFIVFLAFLVNRNELPKTLQPGFFASASMLMAGLFYLGFAGLYFADMAGLVGSA
tara:strand:- start:126377 stop:127735 length:1359 start_codon:yes stop_codon:yes gene_type:complete